MKKNYIAPKTVSVEVDCMELIAQSPEIQEQNLTEGHGDNGIDLVKGQSLNYSVWDEEW